MIPRDADIDTADLPERFAAGTLSLADGLAGALTAALVRCAVAVLLAAGAGCAGEPGADPGGLADAATADVLTGADGHPLAGDASAPDGESPAPDVITAAPDGTGAGNDAGPGDDAAPDAGAGDDAAGDASGEDGGDTSADGGTEDVRVDTAGPGEDSGGPAPPDRSFTIRFATYNVRTSNLSNSAWGDTHVGFDGNDLARMNRAADTIASQSLTVVSTQEVRRAERDAIVDRLRSQHGQTWNVTTQTQGADDSVVLFDRSVWTKVRETHFQIPLQPGLNDRSQIGVLLEHKATGARIWFYSVHLAAHPEGAAARTTGIQRTVASIKEHAVDPGQLFVLGGDFNTDSTGVVGDVLRDSGFARYTRNAAEQRVNDGCNTFNGRAGSAGQQTCPGGQGRHIDQVWVSRSGLKVLRYQVTATAETSRASDHNPLTTILEKQ